MDKFKGKYRIPSARWTTWGYGGNAALEVRRGVETQDLASLRSTVYGHG